MKTFRWLEHMPEHRIQELERTMYARWITAGQSLGACMTDPMVLKEVLHDLTESERVTLDGIMRTFGVRAFTYDENERAIELSLAGSERQLAFLRLRQKGILYTMKKLWGERVHYIPREMFAAWQQTLYFKGGLQGQEEKPTQLRPMTPGLSGAMFRLLRLIGTEGWAVTQKGLLQKKQVQRAAAVLPIQNIDFEGLETRYAHAEVYPPAFAFAMDTALRLELLQLNIDRCRLHEEAVQRWLSLSNSEREQQLMEKWYELHLSEAVWLQHAALSLNMLAPGGWVSLKAWTEQLGKLKLSDMPGDLTMAAQELEARLLVPLYACGWIQLGDNGDGELLFSIVQQEDAIDEIFVQEDFEIIVPPVVSLQLRWELEPFCETLSMDEVAHYRLTKDKVLEALDQGGDVRRCLHWLEAASAIGLPDPVRQALHEWAATYGKVSLSEVRLLQCNDEATADELSAHEELQPYLLERLGPLAFVVSSSGEAILVRKLQHMGLKPREDRRTRSKREDLQESAEAASGQGIVYPSVSLPDYEPDYMPPAVDALYPEITQVPQMWLKELRPYHESTRKQLIRKAIEYKAYLRILRQGEETKLAPLRLEEGREKWCLLGAERGGEIRLNPEDWEEMQLILPGINDTNEMIRSQ